MADNVTIPAIGGGDTLPVIATDQIAGVHYQRVKLTDGTADSTTPIPGDANGLLVKMTATLPASSATLANVAGSAASVTLQAANSARKAWSVVNDSSAILYVKYGVTASTTSYTVALNAGDYFEMGAVVYTGLIAGIWASATGSARMTEL